MAKPERTGRVHEVELTAAVASPGIRETVTPGGVRAGGIGPSARVAVPPGGVRAGGIGPAELIGPGVVLAYAVVTHDGYHLAADHDDLVAYGTELALVLG